MYRIITQTVLIATFAFAQSEQPPTPTPAGGSQTFRGILMDAGCDAIQNRNSTTTSKPASGAGASGSLSTTTNSGGAGAASTPPAESRSTATTGVKESGTTAPDEPAAGTGTRSRSADESSAKPNVNTVREKYKDCKVTSSTKSFALMSGGKLYTIDDSSRSLLQSTATSGYNPGVTAESSKTTAESSKTIAESSKTSEWRTVTVTGTLDGERLRVTSVQ